MAAKDWIIVVGLAASFPVWLIAVRHQWSRRRGATRHMLTSCVGFVAIIALTVIAAYNAS